MPSPFARLVAPASLAAIEAALRATDTVAKAAACDTTNEIRAGINQKFPVGSVYLIGLFRA
jgi:hypothetical protein